MWRRFATFGLQKAKYLCPYKSRKVLSQALQFQTLTAQSPVGYVKHRLAYQGTLGTCLYTRLRRAYVKSSAALSLSGRTRVGIGRKLTRYAATR